MTTILPSTMGTQGFKMPAARSGVLVNIHQTIEHSTETRADTDATDERAVAAINELAQGVGIDLGTRAHSPLAMMWRQLFPAEDEELEAVATVAVALLVRALEVRLTAPPL